MSKYWRNLIRFSLVVVLVGGICLLTGLLVLQVQALLTVKRVPMKGSPTIFALPYEELTLTTTDGISISAWHIRGPRPQAMILVHGIDANRMNERYDAQILAAAGYQLLLLDMRGHGNSGEADLTYGYNEALDVLAAVDYLATQPTVRQIGAMGHSMGGAVVTHAAAQDERIELLIIHSSYASLPLAIEDGFDNFALLPQWPAAPLTIAWGEYQTGIEIGAVNAARDLATMPARPVLIIHGTEDHLFPPAHAELMYDAAQQPKTLWMVDGMGHNAAARRQPDAYRDIVLPFLETAWQYEAPQ